MKLINRKLVRLERLRQLEAAEADLKFLQAFESSNVGMLIPLLERSKAQLRLDWIQHQRMKGPIGHVFNECDAVVGISVFWADPPIAVQASLTGAMPSAIATKRQKGRLFLTATVFYYKRLKRRYVDRWLGR